jgi:hypothetical protein
MANAWPGSQRHGQVGLLPRSGFCPAIGRRQMTQTLLPPATLPARAAFCRLTACGKVPLTSLSKPDRDQRIDSTNQTHQHRRSILSRAYPFRGPVTCVHPADRVPVRQHTTIYIQQPIHPASLPSLTTRSPDLRYVVSRRTKAEGKRKTAENDTQRLTMPLITNALPITPPLTASLQASAHSTHPAPRPQTHSVLAAASASPPAPVARAHVCSIPICSRSATRSPTTGERGKKERKKNLLLLRHSVYLAHHAHVLEIRTRPPAGVCIGDIVLSVLRQMADLCVARRRRIRHAWGCCAHV